MRSTKRHERTRNSTQYANHFSSGLVLLHVISRLRSVGQPAKTSLLALAFVCVLGGTGSAAVGSNESEAQATVERVFQELKSKNYDALYENLPASSRTRLSRERFTSGLRRTQDSYALDRIEIGKVKASGNIATVDTVLFGRLLKPFDTEGKIVVQQYLVREDGKWKVATGDNATIRSFLAANPAFARQFPIRPPHVFVKKDGRWVEFTPPRRAR
jgi:hypothetical protein